MANLQQTEEPKHVKMSVEIPKACAQDKPKEEPSAPGRDAGVTMCSIPSFAAASELLSAPYSCLVTTTHRRHVALPPVYLNKKRTGIQQELEAELLRFSQSLNGVPLAYDNIRIAGRHGDIYDDNGYIHMDVEANFIVFQPTKGKRLLGIVNKLGVGHVGCLVHGCFNASIPRPKLVSVETWRDAGPRIGAELEFEVTALDADVVGVLLIRGRLIRTRVQELLAMGESESSIPADQPDAEPAPEPTEESLVGETPKKKKKKDKIKKEVREEELAITPSCERSDNQNGTTHETDGDEVGEKKKKKKKRIKEEKEELKLSPTEVHGSDSSGYQSDKPRKKRKHETDSDVAPSPSEEAPKSKKKRKSDVA
ncbi:DNA-directed RNA polymerase I subunit RPA43 [Aulostomus maculatus]